VRIPNGFTPRGYQVPFMAYLDNHANGGRAVWVVHRRGGKDLTAMHQTCKMMLERVGTYWHIFPTAEQARRAIWTEFTRDGQRIMEQVFPSAIRKSPREWSPNAEMVVELKGVGGKPGSIWRLMGSDKIEVAGAGPVGVVFSEFALSKPTTWDFVRPMLRERDGWAAFVSTPRGKNHFHKVWQTAGREAGWWRDLKTLRDTQAYDPEKTIAEERAEGMPEDLIRQEYLCDWNAANIGAVWGDAVEELDKRGGIAEFDHPSDGVFTTWDMGISDAMAIWFWRVNADRAPDLIDHYESTGKPLSHFFDEVEAKPYRYVRHFVPHDARARTYQTGVSTVEMFVERFGSGYVAVTPSLSLADGIQAARWLLQQPMRIHSRCAAGVEALKAYHYEWDAEQKVMSRNPVHDWSSHTADAFRYVACVAKRGDILTRPPKNDPQPKYVTPVAPTLDELWEAQPTPSGRV
jgi:phage terminase large subunit